MTNLMCIFKKNLDLIIDRRYSTSSSFTFQQSRSICTHHPDSRKTSQESVRRRCPAFHLITRHPCIYHRYWDKLSYPSIYEGTVCIWRGMHDRDTRLLPKEVFAMSSLRYSSHCIQCNWNGYRNLTALIMSPRCSELSFAAAIFDCISRSRRLTSF